MSELREVMDIRQASDYLGISSDTLYKSHLTRSFPLSNSETGGVFVVRGWISGWTGNLVLASCRCKAGAPKAAEAGARNSHHESQKAS